MEDSYLVSIIIPVFNVAPYLKEALDSVISQTYQNLQIIVIDDGSTDDSGTICDEYARKDDRFQVVHQKNFGLSAARNTGLEKAVGKYVAFLDSDDAYQPQYIERMLNAILLDNIDLVVCRYLTLHTKNSLCPKISTKVKPTIGSGIYNNVSILQAMVEGLMNVSVWNKLYKREVWTHIRFPEGHAFEDKYVMFEIIECCKEICVLEDPLYLYRKHSKSITHNLSLANLNDRFAANTFFENFIRDHIPTYFTCEQLHVFQKQWVLEMIHSYVFCESRSELSKDLKKKSTEVIQEIGINNFNFWAKFNYQLMCSYPGLLKRLYPFIFPIWRIVRKVKH